MCGIFTYSFFLFLKYKIWVYICYMKNEQEMNLRDVSIRISELSYKKTTVGITDTEQRELEVLSNWIKERYR